MSDVLKRSRVSVRGSGSKTVVFGHGLGCDQGTWDAVAPHFEQDFRVVRYDLTGSGGSDLRAYDRERYSSFEGHAADLLEIVRALSLTRVCFCGHSASGTIGALAAARAPEAFDRLAMVGASPRYFDGPDYVGGAPREQIEGVLANLEQDYLGWCGQVLPHAVGNPDRPELATAVVGSYRSQDADITKHFARAVFLSDYRSALPSVKTPTLVVQTSQDIFVPEAVGHYIANSLGNGRYHQLRATGHFPQLAAPEELTQVLRAWLAT